MIRILIADDHPVFRAGLKQTLVSNPRNLTVSVDEATNGREVLALVNRHDYDLVFLDISMPGRTGLEVLASLRELRPRLPVLILSMYSEDQYAVRAMKGGAAGYLTKDGEPEDLWNAIDAVLGGQRHFSAAVVDQLIRELDSPRPGSAPHERLSARELQVLRMLARGAALTRIAAELAVSLSTVSTHRTRILRKMDLNSNADLVRYALENGLIE